MYSRTLTVPTVIKRVLPTGATDMEFAYMLAPDKLIGLLRFMVQSKPLLVPDKYRNLPVFSIGYGTQTINYEAYITVKPDIILHGWSKNNLIERQDKFGDITVVGVYTLYVFENNAKNTDYFFPDYEPGYPFFRRSS
jgi:ABC-type Fe3+-hydroxamate transport system substrate-binding protein